jgi:GNAT superfamily N-acetyltransferase
VRVRSFDDVEAYWEAAGALLLGDPARNNLGLGIVSTLRTHPEVYPRRHLWLAEAAGEPVGAALLTEPYNVVLFEPRSADAIGPLAGAVHDAGVPVPGVVATIPWGARFAERWTGLANVRSRLTMSQGVYELREVRPLPGLDGVARSATPADRDLVRAWLRAFGEEALPARAADDAERIDRQVELRLGPGEDTGLWIWEVEARPVSLSGFAVATGGARIGPVYTPPEHRSRGYATGLVAAQSAWLLGAGLGPCFLYTDLANPTSNAIYARIGFERICDSEERAFDPA